MCKGNPNPAISNAADYAPINQIIERFLNIFVFAIQGDDVGTRVTVLCVSKNLPLAIGKTFLETAC